MIKKLISTFGALLVISIVTFVLVKLSSANPAEQYLRLSRSVLHQKPFTTLGSI
ncbi:hypothetical protein [Streptococcus equi]|uniref:hypothetical protein n=1 Tax=Streptococcus equi TaxID=1336 RepID=UPI001E364B4B|nr:hypothetical protein [Streptococcus equi]